MKTGAPSTSRSAFYDRNPATITMAHSGLHGPHVLTVRGNYTVPANRKAQIERVELFLIRYQQATGPGFTEVVVDYLSAGGGIAEMTTAEIYSMIIGDRDRSSSGAGGTLTAGDGLQIKDQDTFTAGQCWIVEFIKLLEFDA